VRRLVIYRYHRLPIGPSVRDTVDSFPLVCSFLLLLLLVVRLMISSGNLFAHVHNETDHATPAFIKSLEKF
jgi:hypothetical protein